MAIWIGQQPDLCSMGSECPNDLYQVLNNGPSVMVWCAVSYQEAIRHYSFENEIVPGETYKRLRPYFSFPKFREYRKTPFLNRMMPFCTYPILCASIRTNSNPTAGCGETAPVCGLFVLQMWRAVNIVLEYFWYIVSCEPPIQFQRKRQKSTQATASIDKETLKKGYKIMEIRLCFASRKRIVI